MMVVRSGVIGLGFMGSTHVQALAALAARGVPCALAAVCDGDPARRAGMLTAGGNIAAAGDAPGIDPETVRAVASPAELLDDDSIDLVHVCTWTDTHVDLAIECLRRGRHVIVEKPVATSSAALERLVEAAATSPAFCMPAMCMRFWPGWTWLKTVIETQRYGAVRSAVFRRLGSAPSWGSGFYRDPGRSGGAIFDLHIHDVDIVRWLFGEPDDLLSTGDIDHVTTLYRYRQGPGHVSAEGGWCLVPEAGFRMQYVVCFENATAEFDLARAPSPLLLHEAGGSRPIDLPAASGYEAEIDAAIAAVRTGDRARLPTLEEALAVTRLLERERDLVTRQTAW